MTAQVVDDVLTAKEVFAELRKVRQTLQDLAEVVEQVIQYMPEDLYYYGAMQSWSDDLLNALRDSWAIADETVLTVSEYLGGEK